MRPSQVGTEILTMRNGLSPRDLGVINGLMKKEWTNSSIKKELLKMKKAG